MFQNGIQSYVINLNEYNEVNEFSLCISMEQKKKILYVYICGLNQHNQSKQWKNITKDKNGNFPVDAWRLNDVMSKSIHRYDIILILIRRYHVDLYSLNKAMSIGIVFDGNYSSKW